MGARYGESRERGNIVRHRVEHDAWDRGPRLGAADDDEARIAEIMSVIGLSTMQGIGTTVERGEDRRDGEHKRNGEYEQLIDS